MEYYWPDNMNFSVYRVPILLKKLGAHILAKNAIRHLPQQLRGDRSNLVSKNQIGIIRVASPKMFFLYKMKF